MGSNNKSKIKNLIVYQYHCDSCIFSVLVRRAKAKGRKSKELAPKNKQRRIRIIRTLLEAIEKSPIKKDKLIEPKIISRFRCTNIIFVDCRHIYIDTYKDR